MNKRLQLNIRVAQEDLDRIEDIRRTMSPIPTQTEVVLLAVKELAAKRKTAKARK